VIVPDDQLSLAIGREGQNARLAARLTGWRVDIRSETEFAKEEQDSGYGEEEETGGRCAAILGNGRRCPNAALPGSRYCGLDAHQALRDVEGDEVAALADGGGEGVSAENGGEPPAPAAEAPASEPVAEVSEAPTADGEVVAEATSETEIAVAESSAGVAGEEAAEEDAAS